MKPRAPSAGRDAGRLLLVVVGLVGAVGGGWWLGLILLVLASPARSFFDLAAAMVCVGALVGIARLVENAGGSLRLFAALVVAGGVAALL